MARSGSLVVNNSWAIFHSSWDFPVSKPQNYTHNPNHPFNLMVGAVVCNRSLMTAKGTPSASIRINWRG